MADEVHFLLHVPKCAGTTVEAHFRRHLGPAFRLAPRWENVLRNVVGNRYPGFEAEGLRAVSGHSLSVSLKAKFPGAEIRESVLIRAPAEIHISNYRYRQKRHAEGWGPEPPDFSTWYGAQRRNPVTRFLLNRYFEWGVPALYRLSSDQRLAWLEERLAGFHFVGGLAHTDEMIAGLSRSLGIPETAERENVSGGAKAPPVRMPKGMEQRMAEENALDQALFERWRDRRWEGGPGTPPPALPRRDRLAQAGSDLRTVVKRKLG